MIGVSGFSLDDMIMRGVRDWTLMGKKLNYSYISQIQRKEAFQTVDL